MFFWTSYLASLLLASSGRLSNGASSDFFPFGTTAGDSCGSVSESTRLVLDAPVVFYNSSYNHVFVGQSGLVTLGAFFSRGYNPRLNITLPYSSPIATVPFLAPLWNSGPVLEKGSICFRQTQRRSLLRRFVDNLSATNSNFASFQPQLLYIATFREVTFSLDLSRNITYQAILATDGINSFSCFIYGNISSDVGYIVGFNKGDFQTGVLIGGTDPELDIPLITDSDSVATAIFKIDGACVTLASSSCSLYTIATSCSGSPALSAQSCDCSPGFEDVTRNNTNCQDIDECLDSSACPPGSECVNSLGSFSCPCKQGFYTTKRTMGCVDADECSINIDDCDSNAICNNTMGGFTCTCASGYFGDGTTCVAEGTHNVSCVEGSENCMCVDRSGERLCYCTPGYELSDGLRTCRDINECERNMSACNINSVCLNTNGSYFCACLDGYVTGSDGITCVDLNECAVDGLNSCHENASCINTKGSFSCLCRDGFNGNGTHCFTDDICSPGTHSCQICSPVLSNSYRCLCYPGYFLASDGFSCYDVDECQIDLNNCHANASCTNTNGSFECACHDGFYGNGITCEDVDECSSGLADCGSSRFCNNTSGAFECNCPAEKDYDEQTDQCRFQIAPVIRHIPVRKPVGQHLYGIGNNFCIEGSDDDNITITILCKQELPMAFPTAVTSWTYRDASGSYPLPSTSLSVAVQFNGTTLVLGPTSIASLNILSFGNFVLCDVSNPVGRDSRRTIFKKCGPTECDSGTTNNCTMNCRRQDSNYSCFCSSGYQLQSDQVSCSDKDECTLGIDECNITSTRCHNTEGTYSCDCLPGYQLPSGIDEKNTRECLDINECVTDLDNCEQLCKNTHGSFNCSCYLGYELMQDGHSCEDVDECRLNIDNCTATQFCNNTEGGFICNCLNGFQLNSTSGDCDNINECGIGAHDCDITTTNCRDTFGSYECVCQSGYMSSGNATTFCVDVNECLAFDSACNGSGQCENTIGSFICTPVCGILEARTGLGCQVSAPAVGGILAGFMLLLVIIIVVFILVTVYKHKRKEKVGHEDVGYYINHTVELELDALPKELRIPFRELSVDNKMIGEGEFGSVYKAIYRNDAVAVKFLKAVSDRFDVKGVVSEIMKMKDFVHPNILTLIGVAIDHNNKPCIIMPFMWDGSLDVYLRKEENREMLLLEDKTIDSARVVKASVKLLDYCLQIAKGMQYLSSKGVIHRDLAARNCMLGLNNVIKVSDFGLSVTVEDDKDYYKMSDITRDKLPLKWLALECLSDHKFSEATDVWSYGVTCWEVFNGGRKPYPGISPIDLKENLENGHRMAKPSNLACTDDIYTMIMQSCWERNPPQRPRFSNLVDQISRHLLDLQEYLLLE